MITYIRICYKKLYHALFAFQSQGKCIAVGQIKVVLKQSKGK